MMSNYIINILCTIAVGMSLASISSVIYDIIERIKEKNAMEYFRNHTELEKKYQKDLMELEMEYTEQRIKLEKMKFEIESEMDTLKNENEMEKYKVLDAKINNLLERYKNTV